MYVLHRRHRAMIVSVTTGTADSPSSNVRYGVMINPSGILDLFKRLDVVGIALSVHRRYEGSAFALGEGDTQGFGGRRISGGGRDSSRGSGGDVRRLILFSWYGFWPPIPICPN